MPRKKGIRPARLGSTFRLDEDLVEAMQRLHERDGILPSEQVRRALRSWLENKGLLRPKPRSHGKHA
jgi:hypothetical protein